MTLFFLSEEKLLLCHRYSTSQWLVKEASFASLDNRPSGIFSPREQLLPCPLCRGKYISSLFMFRECLVQYFGVLIYDLTNNSHPHFNELIRLITVIAQYYYYHNHYGENFKY